MTEVKNKYAFFKRNGSNAPRAAVYAPVTTATAADDTHAVAAASEVASVTLAESAQAEMPQQPTHSNDFCTPSPNQAAPMPPPAARSDSPSRNPFAATAAASNSHSASLQARLGPVNLPPRAPSTQGAGETSESSLRRRMASPNAAAAELAANGGGAASAASPRRPTKAVATPGGNNVVFSMPVSKNGEWTGMTSPRPPTVAPLPPSTTTIGSFGEPVASSHSFGQPIHNPFESTGSKMRGTRKHSDPDLNSSFAKTKPAATWSTRLRTLRGLMFAPLRRLMAKLRPRDSKKDDEVNANHHFSSHKFAAPSPREAPKKTMPRSNSSRAALIKNVLFFVVLSLALLAFYLWYTHDCTDEFEEDEPTHTVVLAGIGGGHLSVPHHTPLNPASEPGGIVASYLGSSLQEFEMMYPFLHPVLHFFKRPIDHSTHSHTLGAQKAVPFTLVSLLRDMTPEFMLENKASYVFQYNALLSWVRLTPFVIVYMDTVDSCAKLTARPEFAAVKCFAVPCVHESVRRPLLNCIFEHSHRESTTEAMGFVNGDIILSPAVKQLVNKIGNEFQKYLVVSRRTDTHLPEYLIDAFIENYTNQGRADTEGIEFTPAIATDPEGVQHVVPDNVETAMAYAQQTAVLHSEFGIDLFLYPRSTFQWMFPAFPPFLAGVYRWDNYFLTKMILHPEVSTIDASAFGLLVHQQVDGGKDHSKRTGAPINDHLVKQHLGSVYKLGHIKNVDYVLSGQCPDKCEIIPNVNASVSVLYAKRANKANWMAIIHVNANEHIELNNFICWSNRVQFRNFIFLTRDASMYEEIMKRDMPVIYLDRTLVDSARVQALSAKAGGKSSQLDPNVESAAAKLQRYDFLFSVLKAGYHFFYASVRGIYLDDPLRTLSAASEGELFDITVRGNATYVVPAPHAGPLAVRSTNYGQYFWKQVHDCADMNKHIADPAQWVDCIQHNWRVLKGGVKKGNFDDMLFTDAKTVFTDKTPLTHGHYPIMIQDDAVTDNVDKFNRLKDWGLMATQASSSVCRDDLPSSRATIFKPPTEKASQDFRLKVRVLTFNRHASLKRLLDILATSNYDNDRVDLEISIDYPLNMSDTATIAEWTTTQLTARSFAWSHGNIEVIQQRTHIGLTGQWTQGWYPPDDNKEVMLFLEDDTGVSPYYYTFVKKMILTYYLNPKNYDPSLYGFALQTQHTILGETPEGRYGVRKVPDLLNATAQARHDPDSTRYFRYQLVGTWGGVFFPQHWREFLIWLREKQFIHAQGVSPIFQPCVPTLVSNAWWQKKPHKVWSQWFVRFAFEKGWYNMYTNYPNQLSLVGNFREGGENFAITKGLMNEMVDEINTPIGSPLFTHIHDEPLPVPVSSIPLYDFHFNEVTNEDSLKHRRAVWGNKDNIDQCLTIAELKKQQKEAANKLKAKLDAKAKELERRAKQGKEDDSSMVASFAALESTMHALNKKGVVPPAAAAKPDAKAKAKVDPKKKDAKADAKKPAAKPDAKKAAADKKKADEKKAAAAKKDGKKPDDKKAAADAKKKADAAKKKADAAKKAEPAAETEAEKPAEETPAEPATETAETTEKEAAAAEETAKETKDET